MSESWDYRNTLREFARVPERLRRQVEAFLAGSSGMKRYLLGRNPHSLRLSQCIDIDGFVDDFAQQGMLWHGKPVIKMAELETDSTVVNCSMSISPVSAVARLRQSKSAVVLNYSDLCRVSPSRIALPDFVAATRRAFVENEANFTALYEVLADDVSRSVMRAVTAYRLTADPACMADFRVRLAEQYFEDFLDLPEAVFVDAGGFDGDTTELFCRRHPDYRKIFLFEPSAKNIEAARARLADYRDIEFIPLGLSHSEGSLAFNPDAGPASAVTAEGAVQIQVTTLDRAIARRISFVKMDLEGWELNALQGSAGHIERDAPALAIAVYHHPSDFWRVCEYVLGIRASYRVYLRHYTEGWSESVMYFVPDE